MRCICSWMARSTASSTMAAQHTSNTGSMPCDTHNLQKAGSLDEDGGVVVVVAIGAGLGRHSVNTAQPDRTVSRSVLPHTAISGEDNESCAATKRGWASVFRWRCLIPFSVAAATWIAYRTRSGYLPSITTSAQWYNGRSPPFSDDADNDDDDDDQSRSRARVEVAGS